jgi:hypothetical protein
VLVNTRTGPFDVEIHGSKTAAIVFDAWDNHWCQTAHGNMEQVSLRIPKTLDHLRDLRCTIIHAPSGVMDYYAGVPGRDAVLALPEIGPPGDFELVPPLPVFPYPNDGCECPQKSCTPSNNFKKQTDLIPIRAGDFISDDRVEIHSILRNRGVSMTIALGFHLNMCITDRPFGVRALAAWQVSPVVVTDLTDGFFGSLYNHQKIMERYVDHLRMNTCGTTTSQQILG